LIVGLCTDLLARTGDRIPTRLEEVARVRAILRIDHEDLGPDSNWWSISQEQHPGGSWSAAIVDHRGAYRVVLDTSDPLERQRFSLAHEIVHTFFLEVEHEADEPAGDQLEQLCDLGAAELVMPAGPFSNALARAELSLTLIRQLADKFAVSLQACARRAMYLTTEKACIWVVERNRPGQPVTAEMPPLISRSYASSAWHELSAFQGTAIAEYSAAARAMNSQADLVSTEAIPSIGNVTVEALGYRFQGGRLGGHARAIALVTPLPPQIARRP
jgi:hypothetical protein